MINDLRLLIERRLNSIKTEYGIKEISYRVASDKQLYPHIVYDFTDVSPTDMGREDFTVDVHIWDKDRFRAFEILDALREVFAFLNAPHDLDQEDLIGVIDPQTILPTFYEMSSGSIDDPDKSIIHIVLRMQVQVYETSATDAGILGKE